MEDVFVTMYSDSYIISIARYASRYVMLVITDYYSYLLSYTYLFLTSVLRLYGHYATVYINCVYIISYIVSLISSVSLFSSFSYVVSHHCSFVIYFSLSVILN